MSKEGLNRRQFLAGTALSAAALAIGESAEAQEAGEEIFAKEPGTLEERKLLAQQLVDHMQSFPEDQGTWSKRFQIGSADVVVDLIRQDGDGSLAISINGNDTITASGPAFYIRDWDITGEVGFARPSMQGTKYEFEITKEKRDPAQLDLARRLYKGIMEAILAQF